MCTTLPDKLGLRLPFCHFDGELNSAHLNQICLYSINLNLHGVGGGGRQQVYNQAAIVNSQCNFAT